MADLFQTTDPNSNIHIGHIFAEGELLEDSVVKDFLITAADGKNYPTKLYNLDVIISVGYRVKFLRGTQFRIWGARRGTPDPRKQEWTSVAPGGRVLTEESENEPGKALWPQRPGANKEAKIKYTVPGIPEYWAMTHGHANPFCFYRKKHAMLPQILFAGGS